MFAGRTSAVRLTTTTPSRRKGIVECGVRAMSLFAAKPVRRRFARPITGQAGRHDRWNALMANAPEALAPALAACFRESGRTARVEAIQGDVVHVALSLAAVTAAVPTTNFARTPDGAVGLRSATPVETAEWYRQYVASQILLVAEECFAAGPMLVGVNLVASYDGRPLVAARLARAALDRADWGSHPWDALTEADPGARFRLSGPAREFRPIEVSGADIAVISAS
jgi:hypothetical protein